MQWLMILLQAINLIKPVVQTVEQIAAENASGADKKAMARTAIGAATGIAGNFLNPADQAKADAISNLVNHSIDSTVSILNSNGSMPTKILSAVTQDVTAGAVATAVATGAIPVG